MAPPSPAIGLRHFRYFLAVMEELHFGRAADRLRIAQPPLSQAILKLESELGVQLLHRTTRVVTPTEAGRVLAQEARKTLASFDLAVAEARRAGGAGSTLRIGCVPLLPMALLHRFLGALREHARDYQAEVTHLPSLDQVRRLQRGDLDLGIFHHAGDPEGIETEPLFAGESLAALLPTGHRLSSVPVLGPADLQEEILATFRRDVNPSLYDGLMSRIQDAGYRFRGVREVGGPSRRDLMVAAALGLGVAIGPFSTREVEEEPMVIRRALDPPLLMPDTVLAWRATPPRQLRPVLAAARDVARGLRGATS